MHGKLGAVAELILGNVSFSRSRIPTLWRIPSVARKSPGTVLWRIVESWAAKAFDRRFLLSSSYCCNTIRVMITPLN